MVSYDERRYNLPSPLEVGLEKYPLLSLSAAEQIQLGVACCINFVSVKLEIWGSRDLDRPMADVLW